MDAPEGLCPLCRPKVGPEKNFGGRKRIAYAVATGVTLVALFYLVENWRGQRAWNETKARLEARGEQLDWAAFVPKARVPDEQNTFKHPFIVEYGLGKNGYGATPALNWFDHGFPDLGIPISLATLQELPPKTRAPVSLLSLHPELAKAKNNADEEYEFTLINAPLRDAVKGLARAAQLYSRA